MNRSISDIKRIVEMKEWLAPSSSDLKGSGNLGERCTQLLAIFNPCDPQYGLQKHFGRDLSIYNPRSPNYVGDYRSVHLILNRNGASGTQYGHLFKGNVSTFKEL